LFLRDFLASLSLSKRTQASALRREDNIKNRRPMRIIGAMIDV
jgi:hypothetical protein